ncbi:MAG: helix-turn-helix transcriptional regulator [Opitutaceae bacterium]
MPPVPGSPDPVLRRLCDLLPSPLRPLHGRRGAPLAMPDNIICFGRRSATDLNRPQRGRALHHRFVLIFALETAATVCIDDHAVRLRPGEGLLVLPFQFHDYTDAAAEGLRWLFVTFDLLEAGPLDALRYQPFRAGDAVRRAAADLVEAYLGRLDAELVALLLGVLLVRIRQAEPVRRRHRRPPRPPRLVMQVDRLAHGASEPLGVKQMAAALGISTSHLRARFRVSCGVSIGRHLRSLRLEKACGLLRLSQNRVTEIAEQCGFSSIYSFSRAFRCAYGRSPLAYRHEGRAPRVAG